jgi:predicted amidohydrolase YtcJ
MWENYLDAPHTHGSACVAGNTDEEQAGDLTNIILFAQEKGYQVGIHAVGDRALDVSLNGFIKAMEMFPGKPPRHYVIHGDCMTKSFAEKAARYQVGLSVQPSVGTFIYEITAPSLGSEKASRIYGLREFIEAGMNVAGGSDCPVTYPSWLKGVEAAVTRKSASTGEIHAPELAITVEDGVRLFTINGAHQERMEGLRGSIEVGKVADFQVLSDDIFKIDPNRIGEVVVEKTFVGGREVYNV